MFPASSANDGVKGGGLDSELTQKRANLSPFACIAAAYFAHLIFSQFAEMVPGADCPAPSPAISIERVIFVGAKDEMIRINAPSIVAAMADNQPIGNVSLEQLIGDSMGGNFPSEDVKASVSPPPSGAAPYPTAIGFNEVFRETFENTLGNFGRYTEWNRSHIFKVYIQA